jgi:DNA polymerase III delta subunit
MLYFLHGTDTERARAKAHELIESLRAKKPDAAFVRVEGGDWTPGFFSEFIGSQGLFEKRAIIFLNRLFENKEAKESFVERISDLGASENIFIVLEGAVDAATLKKVERAGKLQRFDERAAEKPRFNQFALADALGRRDRRELWALYREAIDRGAAPEELHGILFWQIKTIKLAAGAKSAEEAGLSPFPFSKAKAFARNFRTEEIPVLSERLVRLYHEAHRGRSDFETALERFILAV